MSDVADFLNDYSFDITNRYSAAKTKGASSDDYLTDREESLREAKNTLDFEDMLLLMVTQLQNQTIDNTADTSDMMNQLIQMTVMQAMTDMTTQMKELTLANVMSYSASLVGQYVTVGAYDEKGNIQEIYGKVEAAGTYDGQQVIFIDGESYFLSSIMAVGKLPPIKDPDSPDGEDPDNGEDGDGEEGDGVQGPDSGDGDGVQGPDSGEGDGVQSPDSGEGDGAGSGGTEGVENSGAAGETNTSSGEGTTDGGMEAAGENTINGTPGI